MKIYSFKDAYELYNALCVASPKERRNIIKGANLNIKDNDGYTALMLAAMNGKKAIVNSFIKAKADLNIKDNDGQTALIWAAKEGRKNIVDSLIEAGADLNIKNKYGRTALMEAAYNGYKDIVDSLIKAGADLNIKNNRGYTALMEAVSDGHEGIAKSLLKVVEQQHTEELNEAEQKIAALKKSVVELESKNAKLQAQGNNFQARKNVLKDAWLKKRQKHK